MTDLIANLPEGKQTVLGLYVTAKEAYEKWKAAPDQVKIIDVRTPEEFLFVGSSGHGLENSRRHPELRVGRREEAVPMKPLLDFVARVQTVAKPDDTLMVMCRSGGRSAIAANFLAKAGFKNVYNIIDGMEGDANADSDSVAQGPATEGRLEELGCPWTKKLTPERMVLPKVRITDSLMKELALKVFRQPPDRLNCAQSVLYAWREVFGDTAITVADLKPFGAGRAPDGLCGAVVRGLPARARPGGRVESRLRGASRFALLQGNTRRQEAPLRRLRCRSGGTARGQGGHGRFKDVIPHARPRN